MKKNILSAKIANVNKKAISADNFPIVGIGASAGGLEALEMFFDYMPAGKNIAFIIVQHLDPRHKALLPELLQRTTSLKVIEVTDRLKVKPNHIYVIPPNKSMSILNRTLYLFEPVEVHGLRLPIDFFFSSLADELKEKSVGIILSGMGSDGSTGLRAIKDKSGLAIVQDPDSAKFDGMPRSAIESVQIDIIAKPERLPDKLLQYLTNNTLVKLYPDVKIRDITSYEKILILLRTNKGNDFSLYKKNTIYRRISRRLEIHKITSLRSYLHYLQETPGELEILFKELLIGVTSFFRDPQVWDKLKDEILPSLLNQAPEGSVLRAWVPACSTGEDAYSLAIIFSELIGTGKYTKDISLQIFATDINTESIDKARKGYFSSKISTQIDNSRLNRFFVKSGNNFMIVKNIREMIVFAPHNIISNAPFTKLTILICRNLLIYFSPELQKKVLSVFHFSLNPDGIMMLGNEESTGAIPDLFRKVSSQLRIYQRSESLPLRDLVDFQITLTKKNTILNDSLSQVKTTENIQKLTDNLLLSQYAPSSVLVTNEGDILYITGHTGKYLEPASGKANMNIFNMIREDLQPEFPIGFKQALQSYDKVILQNLKIDSDGLTYFVDIIIQHLEKPVALKDMVLVIFKDVQTGTIKKLPKQKKGIVEKTGESENEIDRLREALKNTYEAVQISEEELKSANEELQSTNEELQSTNEELVSSKEEMQSMNEELQTVNTELMTKIDEFTRTNNDLKNLLESTEIATLFLDRELNIRRFTNPVTEVFRLLLADIGRPIKDFSTNLLYPEIFDDSKKVLRTLSFIEKEITTKSDKWFKVRIMPYRTIDDMIDGLVITFSDISKAKKLEIELNEKIMKLKSEYNPNS